MYLREWKDGICARNRGTNAKMIMNSYSRIAPFGWYSKYMNCKNCYNSKSNEEING